MTTDVVLGVDVGTSGVRIVASDRSGTLAAMSKAPIAVPIQNTGRSLQDPQIWWSAIEQAFPLLDLKAMTPELHKKLTGVDNKQVHEFARRLAAARKPIWVRFVLVPGWTDDMAEVERIAAFAAELGNVERVDVLPFHQMGRFKWEKLKMDYQLNDTKAPSREITEEAIARFRASGLNAV